MAQSYYPPSPSSSRPSTAGGSASSMYNPQRPYERSESSSHASPAEAAGIISALKDKSVDELQKLLTDKEAFNEFLLSLDQVKTQNNVRDELQKATRQLARENIEKEPQMTELRNQLLLALPQCRIIRTSELANAQEKLNSLERQKEEIVKCYSPISLLQNLQEAMNKADEDSEALNRQFLDREIELSSFVQKYKTVRSLYHHEALNHLAAKTSVVG